MIEQQNKDQAMADDSTIKETTSDQGKYHPHSDTESDSIPYPSMRRRKTNPPHLDSDTESDYTPDPPTSSLITTPTMKPYSLTFHLDLFLFICCQCHVGLPVDWVAPHIMKSTTVVRCPSSYPQDKPKQDDFAYQTIQHKILKATPIIKNIDHILQELADQLRMTITDLWNKIPVSDNNSTPNKKWQDLTTKWKAHPPQFQKHPESNNPSLQHGRRPLLLQEWSDLWLLRIFCHDLWNDEKPPFKVQEQTPRQIPPERSGPEPL